jgi:hypothetical protein
METKEKKTVKDLKRVRTVAAKNQDTFSFLFSLSPFFFFFFFFLAVQNDSSFGPLCYRDL